MRRHRRLDLMDRAIPFLAALVGLIALAAAVLVQMSMTTRLERVSGEIAALRASLEQQQALAPVASDESQQLAAATAVAALERRLAALEEAAAQPAAPVAPTAMQGSGPYGTAIGSGPAAIDPSWPTTDCIPLGTRFMASLGDELAICQSPVVVKVLAITNDNVMVDGAGVITKTAFKPIPGSNCQLTVYSADEAGFAEMRVSCL